MERAKRKMVLEYAVISMGVTYQKKTAENEKDASAAELSAILKFGAGNMFKDNNNQKKLEDMNLDDVLNHAEDHESAESQLAQSHLGGEDFLRQFEVTDYKADVKWDDIIPLMSLLRLRRMKKNARMKTISVSRLVCLVRGVLLLRLQRDNLWSQTLKMTKICALSRLNLEVMGRAVRKTN